ncbi:uncharacterized protein LOC131230484 [Magnolia sinica]|uniref:uncharacterized protein LOC131230484 n=1 Tax=Magnolia sinica TaxID=86752 RepID=UPI00265A6A2C|nr:uncharacterized protein LOC131230484 [Magnolia sinica]
MKGLMRFRQKGKLAPWFISPFEVLDRVEAIAYRLGLPTALADNASYTKEPIRILDYKEQLLQTKTIPLVKVLWSHHGEEEATWERKAEVKEKYPHLFNNTP